MFIPPPASPSRHSNPIALLLIASLAGPAPAQGDAGPRFSVVDDSTHASLAFSDTTLSAGPFLGPRRFVILPLTLAGRAAADALDPALPQMTNELGVAAIRLPDGGLLVKFEDLKLQQFGLLQVAPLGATQVVLTRPAAGGADPFTGWIAVSPFEPRAALLEDVNVTGRGDVWLVRLDHQVFPSSGGVSLTITSSLAAPDPAPESLTFADGALFLVDDDQTLLRAPSDGSAQAQTLLLPSSAGATPVTVSKEIAVCGDGSTLALHAGLTEKSWDLYVVSADGIARNLTQQSGDYPGVGHLPDEPLGPFVSLSPDGSRITYAFENPDFELYTRGSDGSDSPAPLTDDPRFEHSIADGSTVITFAATIQFSMGTSPATRDFYAAAVGGGGASISNLTLTSGDATAPFAKGSLLTPLLAARVGGPGGSAIVNDASAIAGHPSFELWSVGASSAALRTGSLLAAPRIVNGGPPDAPVTLAILEEAGGTTLARVPADPAQPIEPLLATPAGVSIGAVAIRSDGRDVAFVASAGPGSSLVAAIELSPRRPPRLLSPNGGFTGPQVAYSPAGRVLFAWGLTPTLHAFAESPIGSGRAILLKGISGSPRFLAR
jgi:hypothetical protein